MEESESHSILRTQMQYIRGHPIFQSFNSAICDQQLNLSGNIFFHKAIWLYKHLILIAYVRMFSPENIRVALKRKIQLGMCVLQVYTPPFQMHGIGISRSGTQ